MIKTFGVIAEFNPFHNGHKELLSLGKNKGYSHCVVAMSGNFVQRGQPAITNKWVRTHAALLNGADLVIELPLPYATATAEHFAHASVSLLRSTGVVDALLFGSESGNIEPLQKVVDSFSQPDFDELLKVSLRQGYSYATSRTKTVESFLGSEYSQLLLQPNNILGIEYLKAMKLQHWKATPLTSSRLGTGHHSMKTSGEFASATKIREQGVHWDHIKSFVPLSALELYKKAEKEWFYPISNRKYESFLLSSLRRLHLDEFANLPDISEGLENRVYKSVQKSTTIEELYANIQSKRYPQSRARRISLAGALGITRQDVSNPVTYLRILGSSKKGLELLSLMKSKATLPFSNRLLDLEKLGNIANKTALLESSSTNQYSLLFPTPHPCGLEYTQPGIFLS